MSQKRLADITVPRFWWLSILTGILLGVRKRKSTLKDTVKIAQDLRAFYGERCKDQDRREEQVLRLTRSIARFTWVLMLATIVALILAGVTLYEG
jgi:hypothetical protein